MYKNVMPGALKKIFLVVALLCSTLFVFTPNANAGIADCVSLGTPLVTSGSTSISVEVRLTVNCSNSQLGNNGGSPRYSIDNETSTTSSCSGQETLQAGQASTVKCSIRMGTSSGSLRTGATSSTLRVTLRNDNSSKSVTFNHTALLQRTSGEGGNTSNPTTEIS